ADQRADVAGALRAAAQGRRARTDALHRTHRQLAADPLRRGAAGAGDPRAGAVRPRQASFDRQRDRAADAGAAVAGAPADPDDPGPAWLLARLVGRRARGHARALSEACVAGKSAGGSPDSAGKTARPVTFPHLAWPRRTRIPLDMLTNMGKPDPQQIHH